MSSINIELTTGTEQVKLERATPIGISATAHTEREKGKSTIRFLMGREEAGGEEPFNTLTEWYEAGKTFTLITEDEIKFEDCSLRECNWDPSHGNLYVQIYTTESAQAMKRQFAE